jgi:hypothetical protein
VFLGSILPRRHAVVVVVGAFAAARGCAGADFGFDLVDLRKESVQIITCVRHD